MIERTTVRLPKELMKLAKRKALEQGRSLTALIEDGVRQAVADEPPVANKKRKLPRISTATGGLLPGIDITKYSDIQGMDDLEYAERLRNGFK